VEALAMAAVAVVLEQLVETVSVVEVLAVQG
jgi:hypothetical protein